jgi:hypothetical protein
MKQPVAQAEPKLVSFHKAADKPTLEQAQAIVGGYVELVRPINGTPMQILCNEDGQMLRLPLNMKATLWAGRPIVGNAILLSGKAMWIG